MRRIVTLLLMLGTGPVCFAAEDPAQMRAARPAPGDVQRAELQRPEKRRSEQSVTGPPVAPDPSEPVPVENPYRVVIPRAGEGSPPVVVNPAQGGIVITELTATPDVASGRRQARVRFAANVPITHYRAAQLTTANTHTPFAGVPWQPYRGGEPTVGLLDCGIFPSWSEKEAIAVQLRGAPIANPNLAGQTMENVSATRRADLDVPPPLRSRLTDTLYFNPPMPDVEPIDLGYQRCPPGRTHCYIKPGWPTSDRVHVLQLHVENYPGELHASAIRAKRDNCMTPVHAHNIVREGEGRFRFALDVSLAGDVCVPEVVLGACGSVNERYQIRPLPRRFERQTLVHHDSAGFADLRFESTCNVAEQAGDFSIAASQGTCSTVVRYGGHQRVELRWMSEQQGNCGLRRPAQVPVLPTPTGLLTSISLDRPSDFHPDYDLYPAHLVEPSTLGGPVVLTPGRAHVMNQGCIGVPAKTNRVRTWIDRIDATRWQLTPIRTVH